MPVQHWDEAALTYSIRSPQTVFADRTGVLWASRGTGPGHALNKRLFENARADRFNIASLRSLLKAWRHTHPNRADAFTM